METESPSSVEALVIVDFYDSDQTQRNAFARAIETEGWRHHTALPNAFFRSFDDFIDDLKLVERCEGTVTDVAAKVMLSTWDAVCVLGEPGSLSEVDPQRTAQEKAR